MGTTHVRCSEETRLKLTKLANKEGISLASALDILMNSLGPGDLSNPDQARPREEVMSESEEFGVSRPEVKELLREVLREEGLNQPDGQPIPAADHNHESSCHECHQFALEVYNQGRVDGIKECAEYYGEVPGVTELRDRWIATKEMVGDSPLIRGPKAQPQTPEGELARAEVDRQIGAIISQNGNKNSG